MRNTSLAGALAVLALTPAAQAMDLTGNISYVSDYLYDGLSQTDNEGALQAGFNLLADSGIYLSGWASQVDFGAVCGDHFDEHCKASTETDWLLGYSAGDDAISYDLGYAHYQYFATGDGFDYGEFYASLSSYGSKLGYWYSDDFAGTGIKTHRLKLSHSFELSQNISLPIELGYNRFSAAFDFGGAMDTSYHYYRVALGYTHENWYAEAAYIRTSLDLVDGGNADMLSTDGNLLFSLTYNFAGTQ